MKLLICNLKMNHSLKEMLYYKEALENNINFSFFLCPATCYLPVMHSSKYQLLAQDVSVEAKENETGSISALALSSLDVKGVLIGHYELGRDIMEKHLKVVASLKQHLKAFVLLTNTLEEYHYQYTSSVLFEQIDIILEGISPKDYANIYFIYEPSWLIGKDEALLYQEVEHIFEELRVKLKQKYQYSFPLIYGGGLSEKNIQDFWNSEQIDGILLGKYSNNVKNVLNIMGFDKTRHL